MSDFIYILIVSTLMWFHQVATSYELETQQHITELYEINSFLWAEGENTTARLKDLKKAKKCK